jgi:hypothetical protein
MPHPRWDQLPDLDQAPRHAVCVKISKGVLESDSALFRKKAGARLMQSVARESDLLTIEEIVALLSHAPRAVRARPSGGCRRPDFDFRITIRCIDCAQTRMKLFFTRDGGRCRVKVFSVCSAFFAFRRAIAGKHTRSFHAISATGWDPGFECGGAHPLRTFAFALMRAGLLADAHRALLGPYWISPSLSSRHRFIVMSRHEISAEDAIRTVSGTVTLHVVAAVEHLVRLVYEGSAVVGLSWEASWAREGLSRADYVELDGTFRAGHPYAAIVPTAVIRNCGLPLGLVLTPTERAASYDMLWRDMGLSPEELRDLVFSKPLLSDGGQALTAYGRRHVRHYRCMRHTLERMGSHTYVAALARRLMFAGSEMHYGRLRAQAVVSLQLAIRAGIVAAPGPDLFCRTFGVSVTADGLLVLEPFDPFRAEAIWGDRSHPGVSTCSNHIEGLHARLNQATRGVRLVHRRFKEIVDALTAKAADFKTEALCSPRRKFKELQDRARATGMDPARDSCQCGWGEVYARRFGLPRFPCLHTVLSWGKLVIPPMEWGPDVSAGEDVSTVRVRPYDGPLWPFPDETGPDAGDQPPIVPDGSETDIEVSSVLDDGASFARLIWHDVHRLRAGSLGFLTFDQFLLRFGACAVHLQGVDHPDLTDVATRAAFEVQVWTGS